MFNRHAHRSFSMVSLCASAIAVLAVTYIGLIAVVMSYAALTVEFSQSVKNDEASVAVLESQYLATILRLESTDYRAAGYTAPLATIFVPATSMTALR
jgi:acyl-coenzyme A synthetase/AMP-(fatty) acid ligase